MKLPPDTDGVGTCLEEFGIGGGAGVWLQRYATAHLESAPYRPWPPLVSVSEEYCPSCILRSDVHGWLKDTKTKTCLDCLLPS